MRCDRDGDGDGDRDRDRERGESFRETRAGAGCPSPRSPRRTSSSKRPLASATRGWRSLAAVMRDGLRRLGRQRPFCHIPPPSEIDWGLFLAAFAGSEGKTLSHITGRKGGQNMATEVRRFGM